MSSNSNTGMHRGQSWLPLAVLVAGLTLTAAAVYSFAAASDARAQRRFDAAVAEAQEDVQARMAAYIALLRGGSALLAVKPGATREDWRIYVERLRLAEFYPGIQGIGFSIRIRSNEFERVLTELRSQGATHLPAFTTNVEPHAILFLEPLDRRNQAALGYNMFSEPTRRMAMERAWTNGEPAASGKVRLVQEIEGPEQAGFLIYLPIFRGGFVPPTIEERREKLAGFVYSPFRADDLFNRVFGTHNPLQLALEVFDGGEPIPAAQLHMSDAARKLRQSPKDPRFLSTTRLNVAGRSWTLVFHSTPAFDVNTALGSTPLIGLLGCVLSFTLFYFAQREARARERLEQNAAELEEKVADRTARLSETVAELEGFSYSISHDLRAPLRAIQSYAHILAEECAPSINGEGKEYIRRLTSAAARMDRLIQDVLNYSRVARADLKIEPVATDKLLRDIIESYPMFQPPAAKIEIHGELPDVLGNEALLTQCFSNLLGNAVKFVAPGISPSIRIWAQPTDRKELVRLCFQDNGIGINSDDHQKIFGIFHRVTRTYEGTGIGLSVVNKSVERLGGKVGLASEPGKGSTFWVELKRAIRITA